MFQFFATATPRVRVFLIAPSKYDKEGFPQRYLQGVISTGGLMTVASHTKDALQDMEVKAQVRTFEDSVFFSVAALTYFWWIWRLQSLILTFCGMETRLIVGLVSVQSHQFPRASDLIKRWKKRGAVCVIGGPHITGSITAMLDGICDRDHGTIPCPSIMPPEIDALQNRGVIVFHGETEPHPDGTNDWKRALADIISGRPLKIYRGGKPDLTSSPLPKLPKGSHAAFARRMKPVRTSAGCPFSCTYCSGIAIQGRAMRCRSSRIVLDYVDKLCERYGRARLFITDDNFGRSRHSHQILEGLSQRRSRGLKVSFMVQIDVAACLEDESLIPALARAGCIMIFMGIESLNEKNLKSAGKTQNLGRDLERLFKLCHDHNVIVHAAYMIGFPHDTPASVKKEVDMLHALGADHASFYIRGDLSGSEDWIRLVASGACIDGDMNFNDTFHCLSAIGLQMTIKECEASYRKAWRQFYSVSNMIKARKRFSSRSARGSLLRSHLWYWWATRVEKTHPMIAGFYRFRPYWDMRPGFPRIALWKYFSQEIWRQMRYIGYATAVFYIFQHSELETEFALSEKKAAITGHLRGAGDWLCRTFGRIMHRGWLNSFWKRYAHNRWKLANPLNSWHLRMIPYAITEVVYTIRFAFKFRQIVRASRA